MADKIAVADALAGLLPPPAPLDPFDPDVLSSLRQGFVAQTAAAGRLLGTEVPGMRKCSKCYKMQAESEFAGRRCCVVCLGRAAANRAARRYHLYPLYQNSGNEHAVYANAAHDLDGGDGPALDGHHDDLAVVVVDTGADHLPLDEASGHRHQHVAGGSSAGGVGRSGRRGGGGGEDDMYTRVHEHDALVEPGQLAVPTGARAVDDTNNDADEDAAVDEDGTDLLMDELEDGHVLGRPLPFTVRVPLAELDTLLAQWQEAAGCGYICRRVRGEWPARTDGAGDASSSAGSSRSAGGGVGEPGGRSRTRRVLGFQEHTCYRAGHARPLVRPVDDDDAKRRAVAGTAKSACPARLLLRRYYGDAAHVYVTADGEHHHDVTDDAGLEPEVKMDAASASAAGAGTADEREAARARFEASLGRLYAVLEEADWPVEETQRAADDLEQLGHHLALTTAGKRIVPWLARGLLAGLPDHGGGPVADAVLRRRRRRTHRGRAHGSGPRPTLSPSSAVHSLPGALTGRPAAGASTSSPQHAPDLESTSLMALS